MDTAAADIFKRIVLVVNPTAGADTALRFRQEVLDGFLEHFSGSDLEVLHTADATDPPRIGAEAAADLIVSLSGDGTVHGLLQGLMRRPSAGRPALTVIPVGSGNDIARTYGIPSLPKKAVAGLAAGQAHSVDVGQITNMSNGAQTWFLQTLSFGMDAAVALNTVELRKRTNQREAVLYARAAVRAILTDLHANRVSYRLDGEQHLDDLLILAIQNGPTYGGGFKVAPRAKVDDGLLDVCMATKVAPPTALYYLSQMKAGQHEQLKAFKTYRTAEIEIEFQRQAPAQADGERLEGTAFRIEAIRAAVDILVPPASPVLAGVAE